MSQRVEQLFDYKDRPLGECYNLACGGIGIDLLFGANILLLNRDSTDRLFKLIMDDRKERNIFSPHVGNFAGDL